MSKTRKLRLAAGLIIPWNKGKKGSQVPWNKGLTKEDDPRVAKYAKSLVGHGTTKATRQKMSKSAKTERAKTGRMKQVTASRVSQWKQKGCPWKGRQNYWCQGRKNPAFTSKHVRYKHYYYAGQHYRSSWEVAFAKWCRRNHVQYRYEFKTFRLKPGPGRTHTYTPDFYLPKQRSYVEIAAYIPPKKAEKFALFNQQYPEVQWVLLTKDGLEATGVLKKAA